MALVAMTTGFILILIGLYCALSNRNILRMIVSFTFAAASCSHTRSPRRGSTGCQG